MSNRKQLGPITAQDAEQEAEADRLFSRRPRPISPETRALFARIEASRRASAERKAQ
jgi:hypothetical protein